MFPVRLKAIVATALVLLLLPGLGQLVQAAVHRFETGHAIELSLSPDHDDVPLGAERSCSGTFHVCACCPRPTFTPVTPLPLPERSVAVLPRIRSSELPCTEPHLPGMFRPPRV